MQPKIAVVLGIAMSGPLIAVAQQPQPANDSARVIPHGQSKMPGPALTPAEAIKKMQVPDGFSVELVASEPDIVNPVAMAFDERGRIWITESLEYPRSSPGPGKDRIKILESSKGDGIYDKITVFVDGLNIPSGIAVGRGGIWVANAPDILFYREVDGKPAGKPEVIVTGFGRSDTHELPNSLTWGPDGWLYGLNGVFNHCHINHRGKVFDFTCALFRIHPKTREFQIVAEGTSNPWGIAWDNEGSAFVSACVIDHLWHLTESGYYQRQGGPYPPYTWKLQSIVKHTHQKAAYCGIHFFDSDAYPPQYRERLYMGNIHGGCINVDLLERDGSTYLAKPNPDFLTANDAWFMPVAQKTGPDGSLYILDWYDRYHCYQDARRDPAGIDRRNGRLYRVRYKNTPRAAIFDLAKENDDQLIERLHSHNVFFRELAQRLLAERNDPATRVKLEHFVMDDKAPRKPRMHALWALIGTGQLERVFHKRLLQHNDPGFRAWAVRAAGDLRDVDPGIRKAVAGHVHDSSPDVKLQVAIAARKLQDIEPIPVLLEVLSGCGNDKLIPAIVWQNLHPMLETKSNLLLRLLATKDLLENTNIRQLMPRTIERILGSKQYDPDALVGMIETVTVGKFGDPDIARQCLGLLADKVQSGDFANTPREMLRTRLQPIWSEILQHPESPLYFDAAALAATFKDPKGLDIAHLALVSAEQSDRNRLHALDALISGGDPTLLRAVSEIIGDHKNNSPRFRGQVMAALGRRNDPTVAALVLANYSRMEPDLQPKAIELLTQRAIWTLPLLQAIGKKEIPPNVLNVNQIRKLLASKDPEIIKQIQAQWGSIREERNPEREQVVAQMRTLLNQQRGDATAGIHVFNRICAQCHKIYGDGQDVGPDLTSNGRGDFDQLLSNVFDPSLVIGSGYQATTVATKNERIITGIVIEDSAERVILKIQGGKQETIPRSEIEQLIVSKVSLMPEGLEKQLRPQEIADLFAFLSLDKPPGDPRARRIPGAPK
jgi:putative membrane-bound dehydrogenase-like protein